MTEQEGLGLFQDNFVDAIGLFYDRDNNVFIDEDGYIVWNMYEMITPNDMFLFKKKREYMVVNHKTLPGVVCELYYPEEDEYYFDKDPRNDYSTLKP